MALEPVLPTLQVDNPELRDFQRRFWRLLPLAAVVVALAITLPMVLWAGLPFFHRGWQSVVSRSPNMWTLISLGTGAAFLFSVVATAAPGLFPDSFVSMGRVNVYQDCDRPSPMCLKT